MGPDGLMARAVGLGPAVDALAALAAYIRIETEQLPADPAVHELLSAITAELVDDQVTAESVPVVGLARTFIRQAAELIENPGRRGSWDRVDVPLLQSIGRLSMSVLEALRVAEQQLPGLAEQLAAPGGAFLDVGTGTGWLAIASISSNPPWIWRRPTSRPKVSPTGSSSDSKTQGSWTNPTPMTQSGCPCLSCQPTLCPPWSSPPRDPCDLAAGCYPALSPAPRTGCPSS